MLPVINLCLLQEMLVPKRFGMCLEEGGFACPKAGGIQPAEGSATPLSRTSWEGSTWSRNGHVFLSFIHICSGVVWLKGFIQAVMGALQVYKVSFGSCSWSRAELLFACGWV